MASRPPPRLSPLSQASWRPRRSRTAPASRSSRSSSERAGAIRRKIVEREGLAENILLQLRAGGDRRPRDRGRTGAAREQVREGNEKAYGWIVGVVTKESKGRADGGAVTKLIRERLEFIVRVARISSALWLRRPQDRLQVPRARSTVCCSGCARVERGKGEGAHYSQPLEEQVVGIRSGVVLLDDRLPAAGRVARESCSWRLGGGQLPRRRQQAARRLARTAWLARLGGGFG